MTNRTRARRQITLSKWLHMFLSTKKNASQFIEDALIEKINNDAVERNRQVRPSTEPPSASTIER